MLEPPLAIEVILSHRRGRGRGGPLFFTVKYTNQTLDYAEELSLEDARKLSPKVVDDYLVHLVPSSES